MPKSVKPVPEGRHTVTPMLALRGAARAIEFYKKAFGARELGRMDTPDGKVGHAEIQIGDSVVFVSDEFPEMSDTARSPETLQGVSAGFYLYVPDMDALFAQAVKAGGKALMPPTDMFWGDRCGRIRDPFGHIWGLATHKEDVSPEEMERRKQAYFSAAAK